MKRRSRVFENNKHIKGKVKQPAADNRPPVIAVISCMVMYYVGISPSQKSSQQNKGIATLLQSHMEHTAHILASSTFRR